MKQRTLDLIDYIGLGEKKPWYQHGRMFYWWEFCRLIEFVANRPFCFFGIHRVYDGLFHSCLDDDYKCYHCRYCNKPASKGCERTNIDWSMIVDSELDARVAELIVRWGGTDEVHHQQWVLDQALRILMGTGYGEFIAQIDNWSKGIPP